MKMFTAVCVLLVGCSSTVTAGHLGRISSSSYAPIHAQVSAAAAPAAAPQQHHHHHHGVSLSSHQFASAQPSVSTVAAAAPVREAHIAHSAPAPQPRLHEIHTSSGRQLIRIEEYARPNQVIRVHEQAQGAPEIIRVQAPSEAAALIRVIAKSAGPAHVERIVHRAPSPQIIDVHKPAPPPARIVQVVRGPAAAPRIEFHYEENQAHEVHIADAPSEVPLPAPVPQVNFAPQPITVNLPENNHVQHAPVQISTHAISSSANHGPHTVQTRVIESTHSAPAQPIVTVSASAAPSFNAAPALQGWAPASQGWAPAELPSPSVHARQIGTAYDTGDHIKILKKNHH